MTTKRKRGDEPNFNAALTSGDGVVQEAPRASAKGPDTIAVAPSVLLACRTALVKGPAACRAALDKYQSSIHYRLGKVLEEFGSYETKAGNNPLHESARQGNAYAMEVLIAAGVDANAMNCDGEQPVDLVTDGTCRELLEQHASIIAEVDREASALVVAAHVHWANLSSSTVLLATPALSLRAYYLDPSFLWAPLDARNAVFAWARGISIAQLAATTQLFADLPDDCAGDVLEYLEVMMPRKVMLNLAAHSSSPKASAWVHLIVSAAAVAKATTDLFRAAQAGNLATARTCIARGANVEAGEPEGRVYPSTALIRASEENHVEIVECLLEAGADIEGKDKLGGTPLTRTSERGHVEIMKLLLEAGANVNAQADDGFTALMETSYSGDTASIKLLLDAGADIDATSELGSTALMEAANRGHFDTVNLLLEAGADTDVEDENDSTALITASGCGRQDIVRLLLQAGADVEMRNQHGVSALLAAASCGSVPAIKLLLEAGADKDAQDDMGYTALILAAMGGGVAAVEVLLEAGVDLDAMDEAGNTALMTASVKGHANIVKLLVEANADKDLTNENDRSALDLAQEQGHAEIVALLQS